MSSEFLLFLTLRILTLHKKCDLRYRH